MSQCVVSARGIMVGRCDRGACQCDEGDTGVAAGACACLAQRSAVETLWLRHYLGPYRSASGHRRDTMRNMRLAPARSPRHGGSTLSATTRVTLLGTGDPLNDER